MNDLHEDICKAQIENLIHIAEVTGQDDLLKKAVSNLIEKGKRAVIGETREWSDGTYVLTAEELSKQDLRLLSREEVDKEHERRGKINSMTHYLD